MAIERTAHALWEGALQDGKGDLELASSHAGKFPVTWASRVEAPNGRTSPEELLAASHAACYAMSLSHTLAQAGNTAEHLHVAATVGVAPKQGGGLAVTGSRLEVSGRVPGIDHAAFQQAAEQAEQSCPISNAIRGNVPISLEATLES